MTDHETANEPEFEPSEYDMTIRRTFDAPRERVFEAWTDPEQVAQWWGPKGFTVPRCEMDVRPGGSFSIDMEGPDGTIYPDEGVFHEVDEPERLVVTSRAFEDDDGEFQLEVRQTVTFADRDGRTELTLKAEVLTATPEVAEALGGMELGWSQSLDKLEAYVDRSAGGTK
ncbi:SRPBCC family protein [Natronorubrum sp. DTA28]|uniref:SRPBCC family protein n=1 Tax=Natronorubrum sp. DTA28 TaxID=3447019 RepID=UPI003F839E6C